MDITNITDDMIGKKITCYIYDTFIDDGEIGHDGEYFCILQNIRHGRDYKNAEYEYSWGIQYANNPKNNGVIKLKLKTPIEPTIDLWI